MLTSMIERLVAPFSRRARRSAGLVIVMVIAVVVYHLQNRVDGVEDSKIVQWLPVQPERLENQIGLIGRIEAAKRQTLIAPFDGTVQQVAVTQGQRVERDQQLLTLDTLQLDIQLRQAQTELLKAKRTVQDMRDWANGEEVARARRAVTNAELSINDTETELAATRRLFERGIVARMEVESSEQQLRLQRLELTASQAELRAAQARGKGENRQIADMELANAQARYDSLEALLAQKDLRAPFAGIVLPAQSNDGSGATVPIHGGLRVSQGTPLFEIASLERVNAVARIEEIDLHQLREGMDVEITGDGFEGLTLRGSLSSIGAQAMFSEVYGSGSTYEVLVAIEPLTPEQLQQVRLGMSARIVVITNRVENGMAVPANALRREPNGGIYVIHRTALNQPPRKVAVTLGRAVPQGIEVSGMEPGFVEVLKP